MSNLTILLVEDTRIARKMAQFILNNMLHTVDTACSGLEAIQLASQKKYDLILMDVGLGDMSGCDASQRIKENTTNKNTPIIALTAHEDEATKAACTLAGITGFMVKPFTKEKFEQIVNLSSLRP